MNLIDHIGNYVTVWTVEGNSMTARKLITADEMGIVVAPFPGDPNQNKEVFVPWNRVKYVDLIKPRESLAVANIGDETPLEYVPGCAPLRGYPVQDGGHVSEAKAASLGINEPITIDLKCGYWVWSVEDNELAVVVGRYKAGSVPCATIAIVPTPGGSTLFREVIYNDGSWEGIAKSVWTDQYSPAFSINEPSTAELVEMLVEREGVSQLTVAPYEVYSIQIGKVVPSRGSGSATQSTGPARILIVTD